MKEAYTLQNIVSALELSIMRTTGEAPRCPNTYTMRPDVYIYQELLTAKNRAKKGSGDFWEVHAGPNVKNVRYDENHVAAILDELSEMSSEVPKSKNILKQIPITAEIIEVAEHILFSSEAQPT